MKWRQLDAVSHNRHRFRQIPSTTPTVARFKCFHFLSTILDQSQGASTAKSSQEGAFFSCFFSCSVSLHFLYVPLCAYHSLLFPSLFPLLLRNKKQRRHSDLSFLFDGRTHYLNNEWHGEGDDGETKMGGRDEKSQPQI